MTFRIIDKKTDSAAQSSFVLCRHSNDGDRIRRSAGWGEKLISLLFGAGGIGSIIISSLLMSLLDRVQNAAGNLVQLQVVDLAYYKQLSHLGAGTNPISREDAIAYAHEIGQTTAAPMSSVQTYVEKANEKTEQATA